MYLPIAGSAKFLTLMAHFDLDLAAEVKRKGCPKCGGPLDGGDYARKPRGGPENLPKECSTRRSLCCRVKGCRKRKRPPSMLFMDRRIYFGACLIAIFTEGVTGSRLKKLASTLGTLSPRTIARWRTWWREVFPETAVGKMVSGRFPTGLDRAQLPNSLIDAIRGSLGEKLERALRILSSL